MFLLKYKCNKNCGIILKRIDYSLESKEAHKNVHKMDPVTFKNDPVTFMNDQLLFKFPGYF